MTQKKISIYTILFSLTSSIKPYLKKTKKKFAAFLHFPHLIYNSNIFFNSMKSIEIACWKSDYTDVFGQTIIKNIQPSTENVDTIIFIVDAIGRE